MLKNQTTIHHHEPTCPLNQMRVVKYALHEYKEKCRVGLNISSSSLLNFPYEREGDLIEEEIVLYPFLESPILASPHQWSG